jgi:hypothetical protein
MVSHLSETETLINPEQEEHSNGAVCGHVDGVPQPADGYAGISLPLHTSSGACVPCTTAGVLLAFDRSPFVPIPAST